MSESFTISSTPHAAFGALVALSLPPQPMRRFTREEASIVARALAAVARGASSERQVYMSPIASDQDFDARVGDNGLAVTAEGFSEIALDWTETRMLAEALARAGGVA
ncbi:MAG TPA: hypothetical protein VK446_03250 [Methylocystis sp.]|nr:hypothetical protein [Methylocystis sp.]